MRGYKYLRFMVSGLTESWLISIWIMSSFKSLSFCQGEKHRQAQEGGSPAAEWRGCCRLRPRSWVTGRYPLLFNHSALSSPWLPDQLRTHSSIITGAHGGMLFQAAPGATGANRPGANNQQALLCYPLPGGLHVCFSGAFQSHLLVFNYSFWINKNLLPPWSCTLRYKWLDSGLFFFFFKAIAWWEISDELLRTINRKWKEKRMWNSSFSSSSVSPFFRLRHKRRWAAPHSDCGCADPDSTGCDAVTHSSHSCESTATWATVAPLSD